MKGDPLHGSRALWNRSAFSLTSDEVLAQLLDRGQMAEWRAIYSLAKTDITLRSRIKRIISTAPVALPHFWLAALASLGESVNFEQPAPDYFESGGV